MIKDVSDCVGAIALAKEDDWEYAIPEPDAPVQNISIGIDGTSLRMYEGGYRETMVGTISLYDDAGERQFSSYIGASPEYGKERFYERMDKEISRIKDKFPDATYLGIADGAKGNWEFLGQHVNHQIIDFYHASQYLSQAAENVYSTKKDKPKKRVWLHDSCHDLKHKLGAASRILRELEQFCESEDNKELPDVESAVTYFRNNKGKMNYYKFVSNKMPIGSGVTEAACKVIIKQRLCKSGMRWKLKGAEVVITLRCLVNTGNHWNQFWDKVDRYGYNLAA